MFRQKLRKNRKAFAEQKWSFCRAIPIVLVGKGCRCAVQNNRDWCAKAVVLVRSSIDFAEKTVVSVWFGSKETAFSGVDFFQNKLFR